MGDRGAAALHELSMNLTLLFGDLGATRHPKVSALKFNEAKDRHNVGCTKDIAVSQLSSRFAHWMSRDVVCQRDRHPTTSTTESYAEWKTNGR